MKKKIDIKQLAQAVVQQQADAHKREFRLRTGIKAAMLDGG